MNNISYTKAGVGQNVKPDVDTGRPEIRLPEAPAFLIILMGSLGDVARGLCLVALLKQRFPNCVITWLVEPKCRDILTVHPLIDHVLLFDRKRWRQGLKDIVRELRGRHFDCVLDLQRHFKSGCFSRLSGAPYRLGFHPRNAKEGNWLFNNRHIPFQDEFYPKLFHYLKFTEYLGCHPEFLPAQSRAMLASGVLDFGFSGLATTALAGDVAAVVEKPFIALVLGSSWVSKEWTFTGYTALIKKILAATPKKIVMLDTPAKLPMARDLAQEVDDARLINLVGRTSLPELAFVLQRADLAVGPDCGSAHVAAAVDTPYIALFGPTAPELTAPFGSEHLVVNKRLSCSPCYKRRCPEKSACLTSIQAADVFEKIEEVLAPASD